MGRELSSSNKGNNSTFLNQTSVDGLIDRQTLNVSKGTPTKFKPIFNLQQIINIERQPNSDDHPTPKYGSNQRPIQVNLQNNSPETVYKQQLKPDTNYQLKTRSDELNGKETDQSHGSFAFHNMGMKVSVSPKNPPTINLTSPTHANKQSSITYPSAFVDKRGAHGNEIRFSSGE